MFEPNHFFSFFFSSGSEHRALCFGAGIQSLEGYGVLNLDQLYGIVSLPTFQLVFA